MITRRLWRILKNPPETHPIMMRSIMQSNEYGIPWVIWIVLLPFSPMLIPLSILFAGTSYSILWGVSISHQIMQAKRGINYDLLCILPEGEYQLNWFITLGYLYRNPSFKNINGIGLWIVRLMLGFLMLQAVSNLQINVSAVIIIGFMMVGLFAHHFQAIGMGILFGMILPTYKLDHLSTTILAFSIQTSIQVLSLVSVALIGMALLHDADNPVITGGICAVILLIYLCLREFGLYTLWRSVIVRLSGDIMEFKM